MSNEKEINLVLGLNKSDPNTKITFLAQSMAKYPSYLENMNMQQLMDVTDQAKKKLDLLSNFRSELNFWCRDNCQNAYKIEEIFEPEGMRVYFADKQDCIKFEKIKDTVPVPPFPQMLKDIYQLSKQET